METAPTFDSLSPAAWVAQMRRLRDEVADDAAAILDRYQTPGPAVAPLQGVFDRYNQIEFGRQFSADVIDVGLSIEVRRHDDALVLWVFPSRDYESIVFTDAGYWWLNHAGCDAEDGGAELDIHQVHADVISRLLRVLPWANEDDLNEIVALEVASRAG